MKERHEGWDKILNEYLPTIEERYPGGVYDIRAECVWDAGQAICAEAYGIHWMQSERFKIDDQVPVDHAPPAMMAIAAKKLADGLCEWAGRIR